MSRYGITNNEVILVYLTLSQSNGTGGAVGNFPSELLGRHGRVFDSGGSGTAVVERWDVITPAVPWGGIQYHLCKELVKKYNTAVVFQNLGSSGRGFYYTGDADPNSADFNVLSSTVNGSTKNYDARLLDKAIAEYSAMKSTLEGYGYTVSTKVVSVTGEKDSNAVADGDAFEVNFTDSLAFLRTQLGQDFEVISVRVHNNFDPPRVRNSVVRAAQASIAAADDKITFLTGSDSYPRETDNVHYNYLGTEDLANDVLAVY